MGYIGEKARGERLPAKELLIDKFGDTIVTGGVSAQYVRFGKAPVVIGVSGLKFDSMAVNLLASDDIIFEQFDQLSTGKLKLRDDFQLLATKEYENNSQAANGSKGQNPNRVKKKQGQKHQANSVKVKSNKKNKNHQNAK